MAPAGPVKFDLILDRSSRSPGRSPTPSRRGTSSIGSSSRTPSPRQVIPSDPRQTLRPEEATRHGASWRSRAPARWTASP